MSDSEAGITTTQGDKRKPLKKRETASQMTSYAPCSDLHHFYGYLTTRVNGSALYGDNSMMSERSVPSAAAEVGLRAGVNLSHLMVDRCYVVGGDYV